jgi:hypothetical protein
LELKKKYELTQTCDVFGALVHAILLAHVTLLNLMNSAMAIAAAFITFSLCLGKTVDTAVTAVAVAIAAAAAFFLASLPLMEPLSTFS